ncbi:MAG: DUF3459 domain-containing protein [Magnetococcales bacterium]|nr:DUF3459 domain-containing protein [Magnetococcales bacterium]
MPFGTFLQEDGTVAFRLWAPAARQVDLCLESATKKEKILPLQATEGGWFTLITDAAKANSLYRFRIDKGPRVPDPASRYQPHDVHGPSCVVDPAAWEWPDASWQGRPWTETIIYELHVGTFTPRGDYLGVEKHLEYLDRLGVTAIELMPLADFPGQHGWGYDGVLPFAPESVYGRPEDLKNLVAKAHALGIMVFLDVVYNHFGPEGNYLHLYAPQFFHTHHHTPWGVAMNFSGTDSHWVRQFFIHNALYWLEEYHMDGLRLDAVQAMVDETEPDIIHELAAAVQNGPGAQRPIHLILENDANTAHYLRPDSFIQQAPKAGKPGLAKGHPAPKPQPPGTIQPEMATGRCQAQWHDDLHHALHHILTGETQAYYLDFQKTPLHHLGRSLAEGFAWQGEASPYRDGRSRGEPSAHLPPTAFVSFLQNHDQVGNRLAAERIVSLVPPEAVQAATTLLLLAPQIPMLFMGQEWGCSQPFPFFCDLHADLHPSIVEGRQREFRHYYRFHNLKELPPLPHPGYPQTMAMARMDWRAINNQNGPYWLTLHQKLLAVRHKEIIPRLPLIGGHAGQWFVRSDGLLQVFWSLRDGSRLIVKANLSPNSLPAPPHVGYPFHATHTVGKYFPPWYVAWHIQDVSGTTVV